MSSMNRYLKMIALDALAGLCFLGVILFGWLPGPGGIPLFLAGLGLLAANHSWAKRALVKAKSKSLSLKKFFFPNWAWAHYTYDAATFIIFSAAIYLFIRGGNKIVDALCVSAVCFSVAIFLVNRERLDKLIAKIKKIKLKHL